MSVSKISAADQARRLRLRVMAKGLISIAAAAIVFVAIAFFFSGNDERPRIPTQSVDIDDLQAGEAKRVLWQGRPVIILRRTSEMVAALQAQEGAAARALRDPSSRRSEQPVTMAGPTRSLRPEWFIAIALGTDQGCPVAFTELVDVGAGFIDECRGSIYDVAGRVFAGQYADRNLAVPRYAIETVDGRQRVILGR